MNFPEAAYSKGMHVGLRVKMLTVHIDDRPVSQPLREVSPPGKQGEQHRPAYLDAVMRVNGRHRCERPWREVPVLHKHTQPCSQIT